MKVGTNEAVGIFLVVASVIGYFIFKAKQWDGGFFYLTLGLGVGLLST